jgi:hypothetical protein
MTLATTKRIEFSRNFGKARIWFDKNMMLLSETMQFETVTLPRPKIAHETDLRQKNTRRTWKLQIEKQVNDLQDTPTL